MVDLQSRLNSLANSIPSDVDDIPTTHAHNFIVSDEYFDLKNEIHDRLTRTIDLSLMDSIDHDILKREIRKATEAILLDDTVQVVPLNTQEKEQLVSEVEDEVLGLGPLESLMQDPSVSDILVNTYKTVYVERYGKLEPTMVRFRNDAHLMRIIEKIVSAVGRRIDESTPMVDARLADGSRVNAVIPPLSIDGPSLSIRRFAVDPLELHDLVVLKALTAPIGELLKGIVKAKLNVLISGGTGSGKTTLLNVMSRFISAEERIVTVEDSAELQLKQDHVVRLETRPANIEGKGEVTARDLVRNCLRMRPDRIIVGEVRGAEAVDMLQAMNTGHEGSLTTVHANTPVDALLRLETMVNMANFNLPSLYIKNYISSAIDVVIQLDRMMDGSRKIVSLQEITGMEGEVITMNEILSFDQTGLDQEGGVQGNFRLHGIRPRFFNKFKAMGIPIPGKI